MLFLTSTTGFFVFCFGSLCHLKYKNLTPSVIFNYLWGIVLFFSTFGYLFGIKPISLETYFIIVVGVLFFNLGPFVNSKKQKKKTNFSFIYTYKMNNIAYFIVMAATIPFVAVILSKALSLLSSGYSLLYIRSLYFGLNGESAYWLTNPWMSLMKKFFIGPLTIAVLPLTISSICKKKYNVFQILCCLFLVVANILSTGGRFILLYLIVELIVGAYIANKHKKLSIRFKIMVIALLAIFIFAIGFLTEDRNVEGSIFLKIYEYFFGCVSLLDYYVPKIQTFTFFTASTDGFVSPILFFLNRLFTVSTPYENIIVNELNIQNAVQLSPMLTTNAFVTTFFYGYLDFGFIGLAIELFIFGFVSYRLYTNLARGFNIRSLAIYLLIVQGLVKSIQHNPFSNSDYVLAFLYIVILTKKEFVVRDRNYCNRL